MKQALLDIFHRRYACHTFLPDRPMTRADIDFILEAGRLSPSSFGLEQWRFVVVSGAAEKAALQKACFNQPQVGGASCVVVILAKVADLDPDSDYVRRLIAREYPGDATMPALENYRQFHAMTDVPSWSITQCHIAAANMMTAAAAIGVDSCAIGGFIPGAVKTTLGLADDRHEIALILPLGYCADAVPEKQRLPLAELAEYRD
jgi:nitroreductase